MSMASSGVSGDGLMTMVEPDSSAGANFDMVTNCGTFQGTIAPTTPTPSERTITGVPSMPVRSSSQGYFLASSMKLFSIIHGAGDCASCEKLIGEPISVVITCAMSIMRAA